MAYEHALAEGLPCEILGGCQTTMMEEMALTIDDIRITIKHGRQQIQLRYLRGNLGGCIRSWQEIACIQETDIIAHNRTEALVHRIVDSLIRFGCHLNAMMGSRCIRPFDIVIHQLQRGIRRGTIDNQMDYLRIILTKHTVECPLQHIGGIIGDRDIGKAYHRR